MRVLTNKDRDLLPHFDEYNETEEGIPDSSLKQMLIKHHDIDAIKGKISGQLVLENMFVFCKTFKKIRKDFDFL